MRFGRFAFGSIEVNGITHDHDLVIDRGDVRKHKKGPLEGPADPIRAHAAVVRRGHPVEV